MQIRFVPERQQAIVIGLGVLTALSAPALFVIFRLITAPLSFETFTLGAILLVILIGAACFIYWTAAAATLTYQFDRNAFTIRWGFIRQVVPLTAITAVTAGTEVTLPRRISGIRWPGYCVGRAMIDGIGPVLFYSTHRRPNELLIVQTADLSFAISPADLSAFLTTIDRAVAQEPDQYVIQRVQYLGPLRLGIWHDRPALAIALTALLIDLVLFGYVLYFYPSLPDLLPLHFNVLGEADFIGPRQDVLRLPFIPLALFVANFAVATALHVRERLAAYLVLGVGLVVQAMFWVATARIVF